MILDELGYKNQTVDPTPAELIERYPGIEDEYEDYFEFREPMSEEMLENAINEALESVEIDPIKRTNQRSRKKNVKSRSM